MEEKKKLKHSNLIVVVGYIRQSIEILLQLKDESVTQGKHMPMYMSNLVEILGLHQREAFSSKAESGQSAK